LRSSIRTRLAAVITAVAVAVGGGIALAAPAHAAATHTGSIKPGTTLAPGDQVTSPNGQFRLVMQGDGNLVEYGIANTVMYASNTAGKAGAVAVYSADGIMKLRFGGKPIKQWGATGQRGRDFSVQPDGTLRSTSTAGKVLWSISSYQDRIAAGAVLLPGTVLRSDNSSARTFTMQADGNLVQYLNGTAAWATNTSGHPGAWAALQTDGNLVVYGPDKRALWSARTSKAGPGQLLVQLDSNVVLYGSQSTRVWSSRPVTGLLWPVASIKISGRYGDDRGAGHTPRYHQGTDAAVGTGTPVYASGSGTVTETVANNPSYGNYVVVKYGLTTVLTAHLSVIEVTKGQNVAKSTEIAKSGNTGQSTGPHVHVETRVNGTLKDPMTLLHFR
jgi:murein DD-endopeptidase